MKLYFAPGACSLSPHIALLESGQAFELEQVDLRQKTMKDGSDYRAINPRGQVPVLKLDDGQILTEAAVILQYLADRKPDTKLAPPCGTMERYRLQEWLNFVSSEIHKGLGALFNPKATDEWKAQHKEGLAPKFDFLNKALDGKTYLMGSQFTVADAYLFTVLRWTKIHKIDLARWPAVAAYFERIGARPAVRNALQAEGLLN